MKTRRAPLPLFLLAALCTLLAACTGVPSQPDATQAQGTPGGSSQATNSDRSGPKPALTIQSGEGEQLNVPWFVRGVQDMVNGDGTQR